MDEAHREANRRNWNERAAIHARSKLYDLDTFRRDPQHRSSIVEFDRPLLGDVTGLDVVHLQCHIGTDTLSLARLGAEVTGLDQSEGSIEVARSLFADTGTPGRFEIAPVYDAVAALDADFDVVYTGVGALNWLPSIDRWAGVVADLLRPGGRLFIREGHPVLWSLADDEAGDAARRLTIGFPYFETEQPMVFDEDVTYTGDDDVLTSTRTYEWNHGLGEIVTAVLDHGMTLQVLTEHRGLDWQMFPHMELRDGQYWFPAHQRDQVPTMYTLVASAP